MKRLEPMPCSGWDETPAYWILAVEDGAETHYRRVWWNQWEEAGEVTREVFWMELESGAVRGCTAKTRERTPEDAYSERRRFEKYHAMQTLLLRVSHSQNAFSDEARRLLSGEFGPAPDPSLPVEPRATPLASNLQFMECDTCRAKPGSPTLCRGCLNNRAAIEHWKSQSFRPLGDNHHNAKLCPHCSPPTGETSARNPMHHATAVGITRHDGAELASPAIAVIVHVPDMEAAIAVRDYLSALATSSVPAPKTSAGGAS